MDLVRKILCPIGLLTILKMQAAISGKPLQGIFIGYGTSLDEPRLWLVTL